MKAVMNISSLVVQSKHLIRFQYPLPFLESSMPPGLHLRRNRSEYSLFVSFKGGLNAKAAEKNAPCIFEMYVFKIYALQKH